MNLMNCTTDMGEKQQQKQTSLDIFKKFYLQTAKGDEDRYDTVNL